MASITSLRAFNLEGWINENRDYLGELLVFA